MDSFSIVRGDHQIRFGIDERYLFPSAYGRSYDFQYLFSSFANVNANIASFTPTHRSGQSDYAYNNFSFYAQDTWKVLARLTMTYGLRWDINPPTRG